MTMSICTLAFAYTVYTHLNSYVFTVCMYLLNFCMIFENEINESTKNIYGIIN